MSATEAEKKIVCVSWKDLAGAAATRCVEWWPDNPEHPTGNVYLAGRLDSFDQWGPAAMICSGKERLYAEGFAHGQGCTVEHVYYDEREER